MSLLGAIRRVGTAVGGLIDLTASPHDQGDSSKGAALDTTMFGFKADGTTVGLVLGGDGKILADIGSPQCGDYIMVALGVAGGGAPIEVTLNAAGVMGYYIKYSCTGTATPYLDFSGRVDPTDSYLSLGSHVMCPAAASAWQVFTMKSAGAPFNSQGEMVQFPNDCIVTANIPSGVTMFTCKLLPIQA